MSDETTQVDVPSLIINLMEPAQVVAWCTALRCTERELRDCVRVVGASVVDVQREFDRRLRRRTIDRIRVLPGRGIVRRSILGA